LSFEKYKHKRALVGAGITGRVTAKVLRDDGFDVILACARTTLAAHMRFRITPTTRRRTYFPQPTGYANI
jgi:UDP-N-acetylmuramoylalanine-D-glutamate ligase